MAERQATRGRSRQGFYQVDDVAAAASNEDLTTYTEVDASAVLAVTASRVTGAAMDRDLDAYLYYDFGAGHFNALDLDFTGYFGSTSPNLGAAYMGFVQSAVNDFSGWSANDAVFAMENDSGGILNMTLRDNGGATDFNATLSDDTPYYFSFLRSASSDTITMEIYSDAARTSLIDTLTVAGVGTGTTYRYLYAIASNNTATGGRDFNGYYENFLLNIA